MASRAQVAPRDVVIITGPTAVGKTAVALAVAERLGGEIISADSVQVYRGLDVGSDKIPESERRGIPHHMIDILDATDEFSAGHFYELAQAKIAEIHARGRVPVVAGGTGFYLKWLMEGRPATPAATPEVAAAAVAKVEAARAAAREVRRAETGDPAAEPSEEALWEACCALVASMGDPESADMLRRERNNEYRLRRVVEILLASGKPRSEMLGKGGAGLVRPAQAGAPDGERGSSNGDEGPQGERDAEAAGGGDGERRDGPASVPEASAPSLRLSDATSTPPLLCTAFYLTRPRMELYRRIDERVEDMAVSGLFAEAAWLLERGVAPNSNCATKAIGYRQAIDAILSLARDPDAVLEDAKWPGPPPAAAEASSQTVRPPAATTASSQTVRLPAATTASSQTVRPPAATTASSQTSPPPAAAESRAQPAAPSATAESCPEPPSRPSEPPSPSGRAKKKQKVKKPAPPPRHPLAQAVLDAVAAVQTASRRFCHRQTSWFRGDANFLWLDASAGTDAAVDSILACVEAARAGGEGPVPRGPPPAEPRSKEQEREFKRYQAVHARLLPGSQDEYEAANLLADAARRARALIERGELAGAGGKA